MRHPRDQKGPEVLDIARLGAGDTSMHERWDGKSVDEIIAFKR